MRTDIFTKREYVKSATPAVEQFEFDLAAVSGEHR
jgi:hypothetical protein